MQTPAMILEPTVRYPAIRLKDIVEQRVKSPTMVHMREVRHFMRHHRAAHMGWCHDQPPAEPDRLATGTAAPAAACIADRQSR